NRRRAPAMLHEFAGNDSLALALGAGVHTLRLNAKSERCRRPSAPEFARGVRPPPFAPLTVWPCCTFLLQLSCKIICVQLGERCFPFPARDQLRQGGSLLVHGTCSKPGRTP